MEREGRTTLNRDNVDTLEHMLYLDIDVTLRRRGYPHSVPLPDNDFLFLVVYFARVFFALLMEGAGILREGTGGVGLGCGVVCACWWARAPRFPDDSS